MQKLKAFTLIELLIGLIISSLVISFSYLCYGIVFEQFESYKTTKHEIYEGMQINTLLERDLDNAHIAYYSAPSLTLINENKADLKYHFDKAFIVRNNGEEKDTFNLKVNKTNPIFIMNNNEEPLKLLKALSLEIELLDDKETLHYTKRYGAAVLLNELAIKDN